MKLRVKVLSILSLIMALTIGMISYFIIETTFNETLKKTVESGINEYGIAHTNMTYSQDLKNLYLTNRELIELKSRDYLEHQTRDNIGIQVKDEQKNITFQSDMFPKNLELALDDVKDNQLKYAIIGVQKQHYLVINSPLTLNGSTYYFMYSMDISELFEMKYGNYKTIIMINIFVMALVMIMLYFFTLEITEPIRQLIDKMNDIIQHRYYKKLAYKSDILEFQEIASNFNVMSDKIQLQIIHLQKQNDQKQRFIENLTHEIRTPLTSIIGYSSLMLKKEVQDQNLIKQSFDIIHQNGERLLTLTTELIKLIDVREVSLIKEPVSLKETLLEIVKGFSIRIREEEIELEIDGEDVIIETDKGLLVILISNLVDNSIKAVRGTQRKKITLKMEVNQLIIEDSGKGISEENLEKIFEPFYMVDSSRSKTMNGLGLGLAICQQIIELLGFLLEVESEVNVGTVVRLKFRKATG